MTHPPTKEPMHKHEYGEPHEHPLDDIPHEHPLGERLVNLETEEQWVECRIPGECAWTSPRIGEHDPDDTIKLAFFAHLESMHGVPSHAHQWRPDWMGEHDPRMN